jgi:hypothetical protein
MPGRRALLQLLISAVLVATFVFAMMSAPGFLSDLDSMSPGQPQQAEVAR